MLSVEPRIRRSEAELLFPTLTFAIFFALVYPLSWALKGRPHAWKWMALLASYLFYGAWDWRFLGLIWISTWVDFFVGKALAKTDMPRERKFLLILSLTTNLGLLGFFKYYNFFIQSARDLLAGFGLGAPLPLLDIILPVGISFYTFQTLSYTIDVYRGKLETTDSLLDFAVFVSFFPQLVAGPIVRASEFLPQLAEPRILRSGEAGRAGLLIASGLFKKVVVSTYLAGAIVDPVFANPEAYGALDNLLAVYAYAVQIYADFSGYTDIAIGIALLLGFRFPQNFNRPYAAISIQDFWRRWHMTLSRWLRDYLYIPLGGSRSGLIKTYRNLMLTMLLGGLWHGASYNFIFWGFLHGLALAVERFLTRSAGVGGKGAEGALSLLPKQTTLARFLTFHWVCLAWIFFRAVDFETAQSVIRQIGLAWHIAPQSSLGTILVIFIMLILQWLSPGWWKSLERRFARLPIALQGAAVGLFIFIVIALGPRGVAPFIYFQF